MYAVNRCARIRSLRSVTCGLGMIGKGVQVGAATSSPLRACSSSVLTARTPAHGVQCASASTNGYQYSTAAMAAAALIAFGGAQVAGSDAQPSPRTMHENPLSAGESSASARMPVDVFLNHETPPHVCMHVWRELLLSLHARPAIPRAQICDRNAASRSTAMPPLRCSTWRQHANVWLHLWKGACIMGGQLCC